MSENQCTNCKYFLQHYAFDNQKLLRVYCGHCTFHSSAKQKRPDTPACDHFIPGEADTEAFATKEYLSKELLQYFLNMELLPEITDDLPVSKKREK